MSFDTWLSFAWLPENDGQPYHVTPGDEGGGTAWGISQPVWDGWCRVTGVDTFLVNATQDDLREVAHASYWNAVQGDAMWQEIAILAADFGFVGGPRARLLQQVAGVTRDGILGPVTIAAVNALTDKAAALTQYAGLCADYYRGLASFSRFGDGWLRRNSDRLALTTNMLQTEGVS